MRKSKESQIQRIIQKITIQNISGLFFFFKEKKEDKKVDKRKRNRH